MGRSFQFLPAIRPSRSSAQSRGTTRRPCHPGGRSMAREIQPRGTVRRPIPVRVPWTPRLRRIRPGNQYPSPCARSIALLQPHSSHQLRSDVLRDKPVSAESFAQGRPAAIARSRSPPGLTALVPGSQSISLRADWEECRCRLPHTAAPPEPCRTVQSPPA